MAIWYLKDHIVESGKSRKNSNNRLYLNIRMKEIQGLKINDSGENVKLLNEFLDGYIARDLPKEYLLIKDKSYKSKFDKNTEVKLRIFQKNHNLSVTGVVDNNTSSLINSPQCFTDFNLFGKTQLDDSNISKRLDYSLFPNNILDEDNSLEFKVVEQENKIYGYFPKTELTFTFKNNPSDISLESLQSIMTSITQDISKYVPGFKFKNVDSNADISISFGDRFGYWIGGQYREHEFQRGLSIQNGITIPPLKGQIAKSYVTINTRDCHWTTDKQLAENSSSDYDVYAVLLHEFCHAIGLGHSKYEHAVMWPIHRDGLRGLRDDDIFGLQFIYKIVTRQPLS